MTQHAAKHATGSTQGTTDHPNLKRFEGGAIHVIPSSHQNLGWEQSPEVCRNQRRKSLLYPALALFAHLAKQGKTSYAFSMESAYGLDEFLAAGLDFDTRYLTLPPQSGDPSPYPASFDATPFAQGAKQLLHWMASSHDEPRSMAWGAWYTQPYEGIHSGEQLVRLLYLGTRALRTDPRFENADGLVATNVDNPSTTQQVPQMLAKAEILGLWISRFAEGVWQWNSPDGSKILGYSSGNYGAAASGASRGRPGWGQHTNNYDLLFDAPGGNGFAWFSPYQTVFDATSHTSDFDTLASRLEQEAHYWWLYWSTYAGEGSIAAGHEGVVPHIPLYFSGDVASPWSFADVVALWNSQRPAGFPEMRHSTTEDFLAAVQSSLDAKTVSTVPQVHGERPNSWCYIHGPGHPAAITAKRRAGALLPAVEAFGVAYSAVFGSFDVYEAKNDAIQGAWRDSLRDDVGWGGVAGGATTDAVFTECLERSARVAGRLLANGRGDNDPGFLDRLSQQVDFSTWVKASPDSPQARPIVAWNTHGWSPDDAPWHAAGVPVRLQVPVEVKPWFDYYSIESLETVVAGHPEGTQVAFQEVEETAAKRLPEVDHLETIEFLAKPPAFGFAPLVATLGSASFETASTAPEGVTCDADHYQNAFYTVAVGAGGLSQITERSSGTDLLDTASMEAGDVVSMPGPSDNPNGAGEFVDGVPQPQPNLKPPTGDSSLLDFIGLGESKEHAWNLFSRQEPTVSHVCGPVFAEYTFEGTLPFWGNQSSTLGQGSTRVVTRIRIYHAIQRIDFEVDLPDWQGPEGVSSHANVEFRMAIPLAARKAQPTITYEAPMAHVRVGRDEMRRDGIELDNASPGWFARLIDGRESPSSLSVDTTHQPGGWTQNAGFYGVDSRTLHPREIQGFLSCDDLANGRGVTLASSVTVADWKNIYADAGSSEQVILQPVLLASRQSCGQSNYFGSSGSYHFHFALTSHAADLPIHARSQFAHQAIHGPIAISPTPSGALLEAKPQGLVSIDAPNVQVSAFKRSEDGQALVLRCHEVDGVESTAVSLTLGFGLKIASAESVNLIEEPWKDPQRGQNPTVAVTSPTTLTLKVGKFAIETVRIVLQTP